MLRLSLCILSVACFIHLSEQFGTGAPPEVCDSMTPNHGVPGQTGPSPYTVTPSKTRVRSGDNLNVTITSQTKNVPFKGFLIEARDSGSKLTQSIIGHFQAFNGVKVINCVPGTNNAVTHVSPEDHNAVTVKWIAPRNFKGTFKFYATVAKTAEEFWVAQTSREVTVY